MTKKLLKIVLEEDVLRIIGRGAYLGESKLSDAEIGMLKDEADALSKSILWKYMRRNLQYLATLKLGKQAKNTEDIIAGNMMFHNLEIQELFIERIIKDL